MHSDDVAAAPEFDDERVGHAQQADALVAGILEVSAHPSAEAWLCRRWSRRAEPLRRGAGGQRLGLRTADRCWRAPVAD